MLKDIVRFKKNGKQQLILFQITEDEAREWCSNPFTRGNDWFDGFTNTGTHCTRTKQMPKYNHYFIPTGKV